MSDVKKWIHAIKSKLFFQYQSADFLSLILERRDTKKTSLQSIAVCDAGITSTDTADSTAIVHFNLRMTVPVSIVP